MNRDIWVRAFVLAVVLITPILGLSKNNRPKAEPDRFVCGTGIETERNALAKGRYFESLGRRRVQFGAVALGTDVGDVAVMENDGTLLTEVNMFDLAGKSFRFEPSGSTSYRVVSTTTSFDSSGGSNIPLGDDDSRSINLGFSFNFFGVSYDSVRLNSDGNLTFVDADTATSA